MTIKVTEEVSINPCPFCGAEEAMKLMTQKEMTIMKIEDIDFEDIEQLKDEVHNNTTDYDGYFIICSATNHGCGSSTGWKPTQLKVIEAWNKRA